MCTSLTFFVGLAIAFAANTARIGFSSFTAGTGDLLTSSNLGEEIDAFCATGDLDDRRDLLGVGESMMSTTSAARFFPIGLLSTTEACLVVFKRFLSVEMV